MLTISEILRGCDVGRMQTVGTMQVIPVLSDMEDERFAAPTSARVHTRGYGSLVFKNDDGRPLLVPLHAAYMVKEMAQDHAMAHAGFVKANASKTFDTAMCIQQTQGGYIKEGEHKLAILPFGLRETALKVRQERSFQKLWPAIAQLNADTGGQARGNLIEFMERFQKELDEFTAQFERVPRQIGAIVLISGRVMGVERAPSRAYFGAVWEALIRECYGSEAIRQNAKGLAKTPPREPLRGGTDLADLATALTEVRAKEEATAKERVRSLLDEPFKVEGDTKEGAFAIDTIGNAQFVGQIVREGERVHYASLMTKNGWTEDATWRKAKPFRV